MNSPISAYASNSVRSTDDTLRLNKQLLKRLTVALESWKDTSQKKSFRLEEMQNAIDICDAFLACMRVEIDGDERIILKSIFEGIKQKCRAALNGEAVDFSEAVIATCFINSCIKEN